MPRTLVICLVVVTVITQMKENVNAAIQLTATHYLQTFVSHDTYDGITYYPEGNNSRDWFITGQILNNTITLEFLKCVLETGGGKGVCIYDNISIYDGVNATAPLLKQICCGTGDIVPISLPSTDDSLYVLFETNDTVSNEGFHISYILEEAPTKCSEVTTNNENGAIHLTATPYLQTFVSHDMYDRTTYYPEGNYSRDWLITGQKLNYPITIEFLKCVLETGYDHGICILDNIFFYDVCCFVSIAS